MQRALEQYHKVSILPFPPLVGPRVPSWADHWHPVLVYSIELIKESFRWGWLELVACEIIPCIYPALEFSWCIFTGYYCGPFSTTPNTITRMNRQTLAVWWGASYPISAITFRSIGWMVSIDMLEKRIRGLYPKANNDFIRNPCPRKYRTPISIAWYIVSLSTSGLLCRMGLFRPTWCPRDTRGSVHVWWTVYIHNPLLLEKIGEVQNQIFVIEIAWFNRKTGSWSIGPIVGHPFRF
jgi:hypothetical protein